MVKYIYEAILDDNDIACKNQYPIIDEDESYYYCKIKNCEFKRFNKSIENIYRNRIKWSTFDFDINTEMNIYKQK